jgi:NhaC family Na+:H+ antiporter
MILLFVTAFSVMVLMLDGSNWDSIMTSIEIAGKIALPPLLILYIIGALIGTWIACGTVPLIVYWGLRLIHPSYFLVTSCILSSIVSLATGSSWSTAGTVGVALMGVGTGLGINPAMTAGAIISGAYLGDKMSPLSDTTNLAPAVSEGDLFDHIRSMLYTTLPGYLIALMGFFILGMNHQGVMESHIIDQIIYGIEQNFNLSIITLIPPLIIILFAVKKVPSLITLIIAAIIAAAIAIIIQN